MHPTPTVLIIEDDLGHAFLIRQLLEDSGLESRIEHLHDGQAALDFFFARSEGAASLQGSYLILLDLHLPKVDGMEVLRRIKQDARLKKLPVVILSAGDNPREVDRCHALGCNAYVQKPVDSDQFVEAMRRLGEFASLLLIPEIAPA